MESFSNGIHKRQYRYLLTCEGIEAWIASAEPFIERKFREHDELVAEPEATHIQRKYSIISSIKERKRGEH